MKHFDAGFSVYPCKTLTEYLNLKNSYVFDIKNMEVLGVVKLNKIASNKTFKSLDPLAEYTLKLQHS